MPSLFRLLLLGTLLLPAGASATAIDLIQPVFEQRRVFASAESETGPQFSRQLMADGSLGDFAPLSVMVESAASTDGSTADGDASQTSTIFGDRVSFSGTSHAMELVLESGTQAVASGQSDFQLAFTVAARSIFDLSGLLATSATGGGTGEVFVLLAADGNDLFVRTAEMGGDLPIAETGDLFPGVGYQLFVQATSVAESPGAQEASVGYDLEFLVMIPEPTTAALLGFALVAVAIRRRR